MPHEWTESDGAQRLLVWRHRSLTPTGFAWVMGGTAVALMLPLIAVVGRSVMWGLLPFAALALWGLWRGVQHGWQGGGIHEELVLTPDRLTVTRRDPGRPDRMWTANPYWVRLTLRAGGPVEDYLTLTDGMREIELGAFLDSAERRALHDDLGRRLAGLKGRQG